MKKSITILVFVLALALAPLVIWDNPAFADFYGDMRRAFGISQGFNASSQPVANFTYGYQVNGSNVSATEAAYIDGVTAGTASASKAVILDSSKDIAGIRNLTLGTNGTGGAAGGFTVRNGANPGANSFAIAGATGIATLAGGATIDNNTSTAILNLTETTVRATGAFDVTGGFTTDSNAFAIADTTGVVTLINGATIDNNASASVLNLTETTVKVTGAFNSTGNATIDTEVITPAIQAADGTAGAGVLLSVEGGAGGGAGNAGGAVDVDGGAGVAHTTGTGGAGGAITISSGAGGTATTGTAGASGAVTIESATGGATSGAAGNGGDAGDIAITGGAGGADTEGGSGTGGDGGDITLTPGAAGAGATPGAAGVINLNGTWQISGTTVSSSAADLNKLDTITATGGVTVTERITITETAGSGTYTATCVLPANSVLTNVDSNGHVNWGADTSAALSAGYTGTATAFANAEDVKAGAPTLSGFTEPVFFSGGTTITFTVVAVDGTSTGGAGRDVFVVQYAVVTSIAASKA